MSCLLVISVCMWLSVNDQHQFANGKLIKPIILDKLASLFYQPFAGKLICFLFFFLFDFGETAIHKLICHKKGALHMSKADEYNNRNERTNARNRMDLNLVLKQLQFGNSLQSDLSMILLPICILFSSFFVGRPFCECVTIFIVIRNLCAHFDSFNLFGAGSWMPFTVNDHD